LVAVEAVCLAAHTLSLANFTLSATSFTIGVRVRVEILCGKTELALYLFHAAAVVFVSVGSWWRRRCVRLSVIRTVNIAIHRVVMSRLRARRIVGCDRRDRRNRLTRSIARNIARLWSLAARTFICEAEPAVCFQFCVSLAIDWRIFLA
jgi:hypothetical protein